MRRRTLTALALGAGTLVLACGAVLASTRVRSYLKTSPLFMRLNSATVRRLDSWVYNRTHPTESPHDLGDGAPFDQITLSDPMGLARDDTGTIYIADRGLAGPGHVVWALSGGVARVVAGTGLRGVPTAGVPARSADLGYPQSISVDRLGRVYVADSYNHMVLRIEKDGGLTRVAGIGRPGDGGDGGPATEAELNQPYDVRVDDDDNIFIADYGNHRIRVVRPDGVMQTLAGTGEPGYTGDGGPAELARLNAPYGIGLDPSHRLLIADSENHVIRAVGRDGTIWTLGGTGEPGNSGDGGPAALARFNSPQSLAVDAAGNIYVGDEHNHEIRMIDRFGTVHRIGGSGTAGFSPDSTPAQSAQLNDPESLVVLPDGTLLFTESGNHRLRALDASRRLRTVAGAES